MACSYREQRQRILNNYGVVADEPREDLIPVHGKDALNPPADFAFNACTSVHNTMFFVACFYNISSYIRYMCVLSIRKVYRCTY